MNHSISPVALEPLAGELLKKATQGRARRAAQTVVGDSLLVMRQTLIALLKDAELAEHEAPGEATLYVLSGHVELRDAIHATEGRQGDLVVLPPQRHSLYAHEDSVVLLTAVPREFMPAPESTDGS